MKVTIVLAFHLCIFENLIVFKNQIGYNNGEDEPFTTYIHSFNLVLINAECDRIIPNFKNTKFMFLS